jgi:ABC-type spermidine/putrescine transport system permease subunit II
MRRDTAGVWTFRVTAALLFGLLVAPIVVVVGTAFGPTSTVTFPPAGLSMRWFGALLGDPRWMSAVRNSLLVAVATTGLSMAVGVAAAFGVRSLDDGHRRLVGAVAVLPLLVPGVVLGVTLLTFFSRFSLQQSYLAIVLAHTLWAVPLTYSVTRSSLSRFDWRLYEAARDVGATPAYAFRTVVAPNVRAGLFGAALVAFVISLQEFVMTLFLSGPDTRTVPVLAWNSLRGSLDPLVSVVSTLLVAVVLVVVAAVGVERLARDA